ncbi:head-to-tail stopper [Mycobacterium phage Wamburgrxpress]|uniref:Head-to-tail stopper n=1 Tax=Mycobacterium phage Wamburgrxpress TaxID=2315617 RepID=A0A386KBN8_9CAUD|nr:head-to-tail stopper [Mycobacterium phage Wamburgrxpress]
MNEETITVIRGETDKYGNRTNSDERTVKGIFSWGSGFGRDRQSRGETASLATELYVKRSVDIRARDRLKRANGELYAVVGHSKWDQGHAFDGFDFGYKVYQVEAVTG